MTPPPTPPPTPTPTPPGNPFDEPGSDDRTIVVSPNKAARPVPSGRAAPHPVAAPSRPSSLGPPPVGASLDDAALAGEPISSSRWPLIDAAAPLLQLIARLSNTASQPDAGTLRLRAAHEIKAFDQAARRAGVPAEQIRPAHYALCASLDDAVLATPWGGGGPWAEKTLVAGFHPKVRVAGGQHVFDILEQSKAALPASLPVVELLYLCLSLGFQGKYRAVPGGPAALDRLRAETADAILAHRPAIMTEPLSPAWRGVSAPWRPRRGVPVWVMAAAAAAIVGGAFIWMLTGLNDRSDSLFARMMRAPPSRMPDFVHATPLVPAPETKQPGALDALRAALTSEIDRGVVRVAGSDALPIIRVPARSLFGSSGATLLPIAADPLKHVAAVLAAMRGSVHVVGYTDSQPLRDVRFPSNFQLSAARARAVAAVLSRQLGASVRVLAEGRGNADLIADETTPEGREENRRVEVVVHATP